MTRLSLFNSPLFLGFDQVEAALDRVSKHGADGYPPYNVEQLGENRLKITLAVAGFSSEDLQVQIEDNQLMIRGRQADDPERVYLHRGIAARQFQRSFVLAEGIEVIGASLENGLLSIELERPLTEPQVRTIDIVSSAGSGRAEVIDGKAKAATRKSGAKSALTDLQAIIPRRRPCANRRRPPSSPSRTSGCSA